MLMTHEGCLSPTYNPDCMQQVKSGFSHSPDRLSHAIGGKFRLPHDRQRLFARSALAQELPTLPCLVHAHTYLLPLSNIYLLHPPPRRLLPLSNFNTLLATQSIPHPTPDNPQLPKRNSSPSTLLQSSSAQRTDLPPAPLNIQRPKNIHNHVRLSHQGGFPGQDLQGPLH